MKRNKLFYGSSYDRGLYHLLTMWGDIKTAYPSATLDICYGWDLFLRAYSNNPERMAWKKKMDDLMSQDGITHHGRVGKEELARIRSRCGIWAYPTDFTEINCITALEAQRDGLVPVVINLAALKETVGSGIRIEGDIYDSETKDQYQDALILIMGDQERWAKESAKAKMFAKSYSWDKIANDWQGYF